MRRRSLLGVLAAAIALGLLAWIVASWQFPSSTPGAAQPALTPSGTVTSPPFAQGASTTPTPVVPPGLEELKRQYLSLHDRAARFALLKDRPEPEAQYLAYRAFNECGRVMGGLKDANDLAYEMRSLWAQQNVANRAAREAALKQWTAACAGFLRPNPDVKREAEDLLRRAAAAGHVGARALAFDFSAEADRVVVAGLAKAIIDSDDPLALFDGYMVMLQARRACGLDAPRLQQDHLAWILATCRLNDCYRSDLFFSETMCVLEGACDQKMVELTYLNQTAGGADRQALLRRVDELEQQMRQGRRQDLLACPRP